MAELHVMGILREKRSELSGIVSRLEEQLAWHRDSLAHLDATMRLFDPDLLSQDTDPALQRGRASWFHPGECRQLIIDLDRTPFAADRPPFDARRPVGFADITPWDRCAMASRSLCASTNAILCLHVQVAGEGQHALALDLVARTPRRPAGRAAAAACARRTRCRK